jgi:hypothetical protein
MPEGLKNADPTFCRMTKAILKDQMQRNVFTYVDDIVMVSRKKSNSYTGFSGDLHQYAQSAIKA